jgi:FKBP-type peptidyl-prolyl cis-trans isomerase
MTKLTNKLMGLLWAGAFCAGAASAQQTPATGSQAAPGATPKAASGTQSTGGAAKTGAAATAAGAKKPAATAVAPLTTDKQKSSYAIGHNIGQNVAQGLQKDGVDVDPAVLARGVRDALSGAKPALTAEEEKALLTKLATDMKAKQQEKLEALSTANKKQGDDFLAANKAKEGVTTLPSGLQYKILTPGTGPKPVPTDKVVCNYRGTFLSGQEFDNSYKRGEPVTFQVNGVIKGWSEALQLMPVGSKWQLFVPPSLAYGEQGRQGIEPNSTLVFEVELMSIAPKDAPKDAAKPELVKPGSN